MDCLVYRLRLTFSPICQLAQLYYVYLCDTVDAGYRNPSSIYRIICILFHRFFPDIRIFHAGYKNMFLDSEYRL